MRKIEHVSFVGTIGYIHLGGWTGAQSMKKFNEGCGDPGLKDYLNWNGDTW